MGLLGLHRNTVWQAVFSRTSRNASVTAKPSASGKGTYAAAPPAASYGMAGLRLGYCLCGDGALLAEMSRRVQPWNVSLPE